MIHLANSNSSDVYHFGNDPDFKYCKQILPGIYAFTEFPTVDCIVYAITNKKGQICLLDTGNGRSFDAVLMAMETVHLKSAKIKSVILTHSHPDHIFGLYRLHEYYAQQHFEMPSIYAHSELIEMLQRADGSKFFLDFLQAGGFELSDFRIQIEPLHGNALKDGEIFYFGNHQFKVLETPGHSRSALCFFETTNQILFSGDTILAGGSFGRVDHRFDSSLIDLRNSINRLHKMYPLHLFPGHGEIIIQKAIDHINDTWINVMSLK